MGKELKPNMKQQILVSCGETYAQDIPEARGAAKGNVG